jgi:hypothetical protein
MPFTRKLLVILVAVGVVALLAGVLIDASGSAQRMAGSNQVGQNVTVRNGRTVRDALPVATLPPGGKLCQPWPAVPADTASLRLRTFESAQTRPSLSGEIVAGGRPLYSGTLPAGPRSDYVEVPITRVRRTVAGAQVCFTNHGPGTVSLGGAPALPAQVPKVGGKPQAGLVRFEFMRPGSESWWQLLPTLEHRFGVGKSRWTGSWTFFLAGLLMVLAIGLAVRTLLREDTA